MADGMCHSATRRKMAAQRVHPMNIFFNISHPAHVHFFRNTIQNLRNRRHNVVVGAREKDITLQLLKEYNIDYILLTKKGRGALSLLREMIVQQYKIARLIRKYNIHIMVQLCGIFNAPIGKLMNVPTIALSDTEIARIDNSISFPLSTYVFLPSCFDHSIGGFWKKQIYYPGYHELAYLSPKYFDLQKDIQKRDKKFFVRFVEWDAGHDMGEKGLNICQKMRLIEILQQHGRVYISSESSLPESLQPYAFSLPFSKVHSFMATCDLVIGESATMASEAACLGVPAIFISNTQRGYTNEQDSKYGLIKSYKVGQWEQIKESAELWASSDLRSIWDQKRKKMLKDKIEVTDWLTDLIHNYPDSVSDVRLKRFQKYEIN